MKRFFNWIKALFNRTMDRVEDPEMMLDQAKRDMQTTLLANKEKAIQAITQRNQLEKLLADQKAKSAGLEKQAETALKQGNRELALQIVREKQNAVSTIAQLEVNYQQASQTVDAVKTAIQRQSEEVQKKTAEALALKAQWKQAQIQNSIAKALDGLTFENQFEGFGAAAERIKTAQSEASARNEMYGESLQGKLATMQDKSMDYAAEEELQKLEQRLGMGQAPVTEAPVVQVQPVGGAPVPVDSAPQIPAPVEAPPGEAEKQLEEIEKRIKGS